MTKHISIIAFAVLTFNGLHAQDPHFSQLYANRLFLNPALTGIESQPELHVQYRNQWPNLSGNYQTANIAYDQKLEKINSGIGAILMYDRQGPALTNYMVGINYAYHFKFSEEMKISAGTQFLYGAKRMDWSQLNFGDMINPQQGFIYQTGDVARPNGINYFDLSFGLAAQWKKFYIGSSIHHVNQPNISLINGESKLPIRYSIHGGYNFNIKLGTNENTQILTLSPHVFYQNQNGFQMLTYGFYSNFRGATLGAFMRRDADFVFLLGYDLNAIRFAYSYDYVTSQLTNQSGGSHEISLTYRIGADFKARTEKSHQFPTF
jgi:type IX secretion system PorP/SprF family membrane protein